MNSTDITTALDWRYAVKKFDPNRKVSDADWKVLEQSLIKSPSSFGLQPWKFLLIKNPEVRAKLKPVSWDQTQITDASHLVVVATRNTIDAAFVDKYLKRIAEVRNVPLATLDLYRTRIHDNLIDGPRASTIRHWADRQAYIAMGFLMETAALMKIDTCPIEGIEPEKYDALLGLKDYHTVAVLAIGYRANDDKYSEAKKVRFDSKDVLEIV